MKPTEWQPEVLLKEISSISKTSFQRRRISIAEEALLSNHERKLLREYGVFRSFCSSLGIIPSRILMLDPDSASPPAPDIQCQIGDGCVYFELCEIVDKKVAEFSNKGNSKKCHALGLSNLNSPCGKEDTVLISTALSKKLNKTYCESADPLYFIFYFDRTRSFWQQVKEQRTLFISSLETAVCDAQNCAGVYIFDSKNGKILFEHVPNPFSPRENERQGKRTNPGSRQQCKNCRNER